jgi:predicted transcriptional regulator
VQLSRLKASIRGLEGTLVPEILKRALSIRQPLSELIFRGNKTLEFHLRLTRIRERVYLYAGRKLALVDDFPEQEAERLPRGAIVGSVEIIDCHEDAEGFAWELANPVRYPKPLVPQGVPQLGFWHPTF